MSSWLCTSVLQSKKTIQCFCPAECKLKFSIIDFLVQFLWCWYNAMCQETVVVEDKDCSCNVNRQVLWSLFLWCWKDFRSPRFGCMCAWKIFLRFLSYSFSYINLTNRHNRHYMFLYTLFFQVLAQIEDKHRRLPEVRARQGSTANTSTLQRLLHSFEQDIQLLVTQVNQHAHEQTACKITCFSIHWPQDSRREESLPSVMITL